MPGRPRTGQTARPRIVRHLTVLLSALLLVLGAANAGAAHPADAAAEPTDGDYVDRVNPWVESDIARYFFFQSASRPFGMVKLRPDTSTHSSRDTGYRHNENQVKGFSHLHDWRLSGVQVMPTTGGDVPKLEGDKGWQSHVDHDNGEVAEPGYHKLHLDRYGVDAELTSTDRVGMHRYTYDKGGSSEILVNLGGHLGEAIMERAHVTRSSDRRIAGYVVQHGEGFDADDAEHKVKLYFDIRFDKPFDSLRGWADGELADGGKPVDKVSGKDAGASVRYDSLRAGEQVQMKVGLSLTGAEGAKKNLQTELSGWDFDAVKADARAQWNEMLGRIDVGGGSAQQQEKFYTDLFHVLCGRSMISDADGAYLDNTWGRDRIGRLPTGRDGKPEFAMYNYDALWLTQWNLNSVLGLAYPEIYSGLVKSQLQMYEDGGLLPRGPVAGNYSMVMSGSPVTSFITGAYNKGIRDFDTDLAYEAMMDAQSVGGLYDKAWFDYDGWGTGGNREYLDLGYVPDGTTGQGAGQALEYANQDFSLAQFAGRLGKRGINATQYAKATASSELDKEHGAGHAIDGRPQRAPTDVEWASAGEKQPWIELTWDKPRTLHQVVLSDRADKDSNVRSGTLEFSDGSRVSVDDIPADGSRKSVRFDKRKVTSVKFTATGGEGTDVGLNEIEAWDDTDTRAYLKDRSRNWRNLYDEETGFIRPRDADGGWRAPFDPLAPDDFVEANSWQATWFTTHDVMGLANLTGGETAYADKLNYAFTAAEKDRFIGTYGEGHVSYGNQPGLEMAHLFNYVGKPWLSQYWVRKVKEKTYGSTATDDGYGHHDEDQGQMGALSALMGMGLFEVTGGSLQKPVYDITSPVFDEITIKLDPRYNEGKQFRIVTHGNSDENKYIQRAKLDGRRLDDAWFRHDQLADGGTLELWMGDEPNKDWGTKQLPPSESKSEGRTPAFVRDISIEGPAKVDEPYGDSRFKAAVAPEDASFKEVLWKVTEPDGSPTDKAEIGLDGTLTVNHRDGRVRVTAVSADSGDATASKLVDIGLDPAELRGNAACWPGVKATASSVFGDDYPAGNVHDSCDGSDAADGADWASDGELNPWVQLDWPEKITADRIVLSDRTTQDDANGGVLTFSDGSEVKVEDIPAKGPKTVEFPQKTFDRVRFQVEGGTGSNNGLLEFEVDAVPSVPEAPVAVGAEAEKGGATVRWKPPAFDGGAPVTGYLVRPYRDGKPLDPVRVDGAARKAELNGLDAGEPYTFTVTAESMAGRGPRSAESDPVRPG
ncbi:Glycosyl hydrolase family 92 [Streptomyces sp. YIM 130001]|uniref:glycoside hydrolase domain-containing protein n=1 Tax=Streptomyces sp. YIM 130001 TaxID=2259644 RepID=UPI000E654E40|nr:glycoside hydrolase domain-containing protein [Streptomyces sp. YIM 130001]RII18371.1 Glycosyl hydrolase family 92 [Streptomyces sp. YIM 130001]